MSTSFNFRQIILGGFFASALAFASCEKDTPAPDGDPKNPSGDKEPIALSCDFTGDTVLTSDPDRPVDYVVDCEISLWENTLTIEPGTVIEFTENGRIKVEKFSESAALIAKGTADKPIIFRGTKQEKGHWRGIRISNDNNVNELDYVIIRDAGKDKWRFGGPQGGLCLGEAAGGSGQIKLTNSQFLNNKGYGLDCHLYTSTSTATHTIKNNSFKDNDFPVSAIIYNLQFLDPSNDLKGNVKDEIHVEGSANSTYTTIVDATWNNLEVPYIFSSSVNLTSKITIAPGTVLKFPSTSRLYVDRTKYGGLGTGGGLIAKGTAEKPIIFTGIEELPKFWRGITIQTAYAGNEISNAIIEYTGSPTSGGAQNLALETGSGGITYLKINDVTFRHSNHAECAIWLQANSLHQTTADIEDITLDDGHCLLRDDNPDYGW